jgi:hypothetical protein
MFLIVWAAGTFSGGQWSFSKERVSSEETSFGQAITKTWTETWLLKCPQVAECGCADLSLFE